MPDAADATQDFGELQGLHLSACRVLDTLPDAAQARLSALRERASLSMAVTVGTPIWISVFAGTQMLARWQVCRPCPEVASEFLSMVGLTITRGLRRLPNRTAATVVGAIASGAWRGSFCYAVNAPGATFELVHDDGRAVPVFEVHAGHEGLQ